MASMGAILAALSEAAHSIPEKQKS
jgi:hypothetical protein